MPSLYWLFPLGGLVLLLAVNRLIRVGLAAPRVPAAALPVEAGWQDVAFPTANGKTLRGWFLPAGERAPALAILHGWGGTTEMMLPLAGPLHAAGFALLLFDARCHGRSDDDDFASLPRFTEDFGAAVDWLRVQPGVDAGRVGVVGHSVGAGAALLLGARRHDLRAVVSLAAFGHPAWMMRRWLRAKGVPYWPLGAYVLRYVQWVIGHRFDDIAPVNTVRRIACPVLLVHGDEDDTVPLADAQAILAAGRDDGVRLLVVPGSHDRYTDLDRSLGQLLAFLNEACR